MRVPGWPGPVFFAALSAGSWEKWADVHIDFGAELYAAWRLAEGEALYRDIAYRHGPLPHHLNALWFTLFGVSIRTLALCNLAILAAIAALQWALFRRACGPWIASAVTAVLLGSLPSASTSRSRTTTSSRRTITTRPTAWPWAWRWSPPSAPPDAPGPGATSPGTASPDCVWAAPS